MTRSLITSEAGQGRSRESCNWEKFLIAQLVVVRDNGSREYPQRVAVLPKANDRLRFPGKSEEFAF